MQAGRRDGRPDGLTDGDPTGDLRMHHASGLASPIPRTHSTENSWLQYLSPAKFCLRTTFLQSSLVQKVRVSNDAKTIHTRTPLKHLFYTVQTFQAIRTTRSSGLSDFRDITSQPSNVSFNMKSKPGHLWHTVTTLLHKKPL